MPPSASYRDRIQVRSDVHFGKPCVAGTRIPITDVLELVQEGVPFDQITTEYYPDLVEDDVRACVWYATEMIKTEETHIVAP
jgi:uncharacterized protein (DUF433 family)